jgi:hypothetical protein
VSLKELAEHQIEIGKNKYLKTDADINPNQKFINNQVLLKWKKIRKDYFHRPAQAIEMGYA